MLAMLSIFGIFRAAKFWVAAAMAVAEFIRIQYGYDLGLDEATVTAVMGGLTAFLVWLVPNAKPKGEDYFPPKPGLY